MSMQDRAYAAAIFIILGLCCIGAYVAISGFMNANPNGLSIGLNGATATGTAGVTVVIPTETAGRATNTSLPATITPKGFQATLEPEATRGPTLDFIPTVATAEFTETPQATATAVGCGGSYCPQPGPPDGRGPKGQPCSTEYVWGFVVLKSGEGVPNIRIHFREAGGGEGDAKTKGDPDPPGRFDFPTGNGSWTVVMWNKDGDPISPSFQVQAGVPWAGSGNCPTRVDFVQQ
jgi:hypothetical protein